MIISHKYKYLFIEIPVTGSYAIHHELCKFYDGHLILHKHASYPEFLQIATEEEKNFFTFATVRNPLDITVSSFFKLKTDHKDAFSNSAESIKTNKIDYADVEKYKYIQESNASFEDAFLNSRFWERPYSSMIELSSANLDFVIRYENLQNDFDEVLHKLGIKTVRPLPVVNKTQSRNAGWESYYSPKMVEKAKRKYTPFMYKWGYDFPEDWGHYHVPKRKYLEFKLVNWMKSVYLINFRYSDKPHAKFVRKLRAKLIKVF